MEEKDIGIKVMGNLLFNNIHFSTYYVNNKVDFIVPYGMVDAHETPKWEIDFLEDKGIISLWHNGHNKYKFSYANFDNAILNKIGTSILNWSNNK